MSVTDRCSQCREGECTDEAHAEIQQSRAQVGVLTEALEAWELWWKQHAYAFGDNRLHRKIEALPVPSTLVNKMAHARTALNSA